MLRELQSSHEEFVMQEKDGKLYIIGSDKRGTAYGILELSRMIGVSPWEWWADSPVEKKNTFVIDKGFTKMESPSVAHRGIFLNDDDWGLMPWSSPHDENLGIKGSLGHETHVRIFVL